MTSVGLSAMADSPAFYDPSDGKIYVVEDLQDGLLKQAIDHVGDGYRRLHIVAMRV